MKAPKNKSLIGPLLAALMQAVLCTSCGSKDDGSASQEVTEQEEAKVQNQLNGNLGNIGEASDKWRYLATAVNWSDATKGAPSGFRLPERWEIVKAFDEKTFAGLSDVKVWSASKIGELDAYRATISDSGAVDNSTDKADMRLKFAVLYLKQ
jgi:hypothetical protein